MSVSPEVKEKMNQLARHCSAYQGADTRRSLVQFATTFALFLVFCTAMFFSLEYGYWLTLLLSLPTGGLMVRLFIIQHDCGHRSFFNSRRANDTLGRLISILTLTPYDCWRKGHDIHHATSGDLDRRGVGDVDTFTVEEYKALPKLKRLKYRTLRHPAVFLLFGAPLFLLLNHRSPFGQSLPARDIWKSIMGLNLAIILVYGGIGLLIGFKTLAMLYLPVLCFTAWIGGWLFFVQHQFENTYWERKEEWRFQDATVLGSSYYALPPIVQWFTGNIGLHHIHHLCGKIPNYRLQECLEASPELQKINRLTFWESLKCARLALWDEDNQKLVGFSALKTA